ncbi:MAG: cytochrome c-type biogenesis protein [Methyloceanibacter sp.]
MLRPRLLALFLPILVSLLVSLPVRAVEPDEILPDAGLETRARHISEGLRCLVCQNQSIDDSEAPLAKDLRLLVRDRLKAGDSDQEVIDFIAARYGEFVLLKPRLAPHTLVLWLATPVLFLVALVTIVLAYLRRGRVTAPKPLSAAEVRRLKRILDQS